MRYCREIERRKYHINTDADHTNAYADAKGILTQKQLGANSADPDQTAPEGAV